MRLRCASIAAITLTLCACTTEHDVSIGFLTGWQQGFSCELPDAGVDASSLSTAVFSGDAVTVVVDVVAVLDTIDCSGPLRTIVGECGTQGCPILARRCVRFVGTRDAMPEQQVRDALANMSVGQSLPSVSAAVRIIATTEDVSAQCPSAWSADASAAVSFDPTRVIGCAWSPCARLDTVSTFDFSFGGAPSGANCEPWFAACTFSRATDAGAGD